MAPQRFGQASDYGQTFQFLAQQNTQLLQSRALAFDRRRVEEQAAQDSLMFERYKSGAISGEAILAYIRKRIRETGYDKTQQRKWREALVQYTNAVSDQTAEDAYAETGDINALISHYADRLDASAKGTPDRTELAQRIKTLRIQRDSDELQRGAKVLARRIKRGDANTKDLIEFYKKQLERLPRGDLRTKVLDALSEARAVRRGELLEKALSKVDRLYARGGSNGLSPQQAAARKKDIIDRYDLKSRDQTRYFQVLAQVNQLRGTPDPAELAKLQTQFDNGDLTMDQYQQKLMDMADTLQPYNASEAWKLRDQAIRGISGATPLPNPEAIGGQASKIAAHISQLDGSKYSQLNCTMAAAAMLAYTMGTKDLSGGDLRWATGDTQGGTTLGQAKDAMRQLGVKGNIRYKSYTSWEEFKKRVNNGAPAVLSGWNGDIDQNLNSSGIIGGHAMFVVGYDKKRDAFLMLDPAKSKDKGTWWPASQVHDFGWVGQRDGSVMFGPRNTIDPTSLRNWKGARTIHVSVDRPPQRKGTPKNWIGQFNPGLSDVNTAIKARANAEKKRQRDAQDNIDERFRRRLKKAGLEDTDIRTTQEAKDALLDKEKAISDTKHFVDAWSQQYIASGGQEDTFDVTVGNSSRTLTLDDVRAMREEMLYQYDFQELVYGSMDMPDAAEGVRKAKQDTVANAVKDNTLSAIVAHNRNLRETKASMDAAERSGDTRKILDVISQYLSVEDQINADPNAPTEVSDVTQPKDTTPPSETDLQAQKAEQGLGSEYQQARQALEDVHNALSDKDMDPQDRIDALLTWAEVTGNELPKDWPFTADDPNYTPTALQENSDGFILAGAVSGINREYEVLNGRADWVLKASVTPDGNIAGELITLPIVGDPGFDAAGQRKTSGVEVSKQTDQGTASGVVTTPGGLMLDIRDVVGDLPYTHSSELPTYGMRVDGTNEPVKVIPVQVDYGINFLRVPTDKASQFHDETGLTGWGDDRYLTADDIKKLDADGLDNIRDLRSRKLLEVVPFKVMAYGTPSYVDEQGTHLSQVWYNTPGTTKWSRGGLPFVGSKRGEDGSLVYSFGSDYVGINTKTSVAGRPMPEQELNPDLADDATVGVPAGYADYLPLYQMEAWRKQGRVGPDDSMKFDSDGNYVPVNETDDVYIDGSRSVFDVLSTSVHDVTQSVRQGVSDIADQLQPTGGTAVPSQALAVAQFYGNDTQGTQGNIGDAVQSGLESIKAGLQQLGVDSSASNATADLPAPTKPTTREPQPRPQADLPKIRPSPSPQPGPSSRLPTPKGPDKAPERRNKQYDPLTSISLPVPKHKRPSAPQTRQTRPTDPLNAPPGAGGYR